MLNMNEFKIATNEIINQTFTPTSYTEIRLKKQKKKKKKNLEEELKKNKKKLHDTNLP